eukprot:scaffold237386_cov25-Prasinocladus_malaysianus.AAC.1
MMAVSDGPLPETVCALDEFTNYMFLNNNSGETGETGVGDSWRLFPQTVVITVTVVAVVAVIGSLLSLHTLL